MSRNRLTNHEKSILGEKLIKKYFENKNYKVRLSDKNGSDFVIIKRRKEFSVEVKTTSSEDGITDVHNTEFYKKNNLWLFVADYLYKDKPIQIDILSKDDIDNYSNGHRIVIRIRMANALRNDLRLKKVGKSIML